MKRIDFSEETKKIISQRAAYRCSFPGCNATLIGPGKDSNEVDNIGECAHIFAASPNGPRSNKYLSEEDLIKPENGIFLCRKHHSLIDKHKGEKYFPEELMLYKQMHEHKISEELGHISYPLLWIKEIKINDSPILKKDQSFLFTKSSIIIGSNCTGKSVLIEYIYAALTGKCVQRMQGHKVSITIKLSNPIWNDIRCDIDNGVVRYYIEDTQLPFCPFNINVLFLRKPNYIVKGDKIDWMAAQLSEKREFVKRMIEGSILSHSQIASKVWINQVRERPYERATICLKKKDDNGQDWVLDTLSTTEEASVFFDIIIGYMRQLSKYKNAILLIDWSVFDCFGGELKNNYFRLFYNSSSSFQTIVVQANLWEDVDWGGWNLVPMTKDCLSRY